VAGPGRHQSAGVPRPDGGDGAQQPGAPPQLGGPVRRLRHRRGARLPARARPAASCFGALVLSILPIALAYHIAHYLPAFLVNAQYALAAFGDPFSWGWNLLGLAERHPTTSFFADYGSVAVLWTVQSGTIVIGHILAVLVAHAIALERFESGRAAFFSQLPLALLMIAYTAFGLWLLSAPTAG
jgi:hypothetical protein